VVVWLLEVTEPGKWVCITFCIDSRLLHVGEPFGVIVKAGGGFLGFVIILFNLLASVIVWQLSMKVSQLSCLAFLTALLYSDHNCW
jgi:hypothetical protein